MARTREQTHWLVHVLRRARVAGANGADIPATTPLGAAWAAACEAGGLTPEQLAAHVADYFRLAVADLDRTVEAARMLVPARVARRYGVFPLRMTDRQLTVATGDPTNSAGEQALGFLTGRKAVLEVAPPERIREAISTAYPAPDPDRPSPDALDADVTWVGRTARIGEIGLPEWELGRLRRLLANREGLVCVTGPAGAGRTTTLYAALSELVGAELRILTIEDPVAYDLPAVTQVPARPERGLGFVGAIGTALRQQPDVLMVGAIPDRDTAAAAVQAAMAGHLVLVALDASTAVGAVDRLVELGIDRATVGAILRGVVAQRLLRRVCPECAEPITGEMTGAELRLARRYDLRPPVRAVGCRTCAESGYRGRTPVAEVFLVNARIAELITEGADAVRLQEAAVSAGMRPMLQVAIEGVRTGTTTLEEIQRELATPRSAHDATEEPGAGRDPHVLVATGDPEDGALVRRLLDRRGFHAEVAGSADEVVRRLAEDQDWTLVVLDLDLPEEGGREALDRLRSSPDTASVPVVMINGSGDPADEERILAAGADDYLRRPLDPERLVARVTAALRRARMARADRSLHSGVRK